MKYSSYIGGFATLVLIAICFVPWVYIQSINTIITGISAEHTNFGRPGLLHLFFAFIALVLFLVNKIWAKSVNIFICSLNVAWAIRNFLSITHCEFGDCPEKKLGIYALLAFSLLMLVMSTLPKIDIPKED